jgi:enterochelin esterase-like enzyme
MKNTLCLLLLAAFLSCHSGGEQPIVHEPAQEAAPGHTLTSQGDILQILYKGEGDFVQFNMFEGLTLPLEKNPFGIFEGQLTIPDLNDGIFSYDIIVQQTSASGGVADINYRPKTEPLFRWMGANRKIDYAKAGELSGKIDKIDFKSRFLENERTVTLYTPPGISDETPIVYMTDGSAVAAYTPYVDTLISQGRIKPVALVGIHSSQEYRYEEYVHTGAPNDYFDRHENFFTQEILPFAEGAIENWRGKRYLYGFSNGGAFCMYMGINYPDWFEEVIAFSTADYISGFFRPVKLERKKYPKFYMGAGRYETSIFKDNVNFVRKMKRKDISVEFKEFISGHDYYVWQIEFLAYLERVFGN